MAKKTQKKAAPAVEQFDEPIVDAPLTADEAVAAEEANQPEADEITNLASDKLVEVWERRFVNPGQQSSRPIPLKVQGMATRWINTILEGRYHNAVYEQGWQPVPVKLLQDPSSIPDLYKHPHGIVCRGERGKEVLMMMPQDVFKRIQRRKAELTTASLRKIRSEMAQAAASKFGAQAGEFIDRGGTSDGLIKTIGSINFGTERVPMGGGE